MAKYTSHGHHIPGSGEPGVGRPTMRARCGGISLCTVCHREVQEFKMADNLKGIPFSSPEEGVDYPLRAKLAVLYVHNELGIGTPRHQEIDELTLKEVYVVWFSFVRGNWKAVLSTSRPDGRIYEVSYKRENDGSDGPESLIVDSYVKTHNIPLI